MLVEERRMGLTSSLHVRIQKRILVKSVLLLHDPFISSSQFSQPLKLGILLSSHQSCSFQVMMTLD